MPETFDFFAACNLGLEPVLAGELRDLDAHDIEARRGGVAFRGDRRLGYAANCWLRTAVRVQEEIATGDIATHDQLYDAVAALDWARWLTTEQTLAVFATVKSATLGDPRFCALRVKDAIVDQQRDRSGVRSSVDTRTPDLPLKLVVQQRRMRLYRDWSGQSLHKRGWRPVQVQSPLNEATAAGLLMLGDWDRRSPLVDPMCGSGTFVVEAAMLAAHRAPGLGRGFAFERWLDHDARLFTDVRDAARDAAERSLGFTILGADRHRGALDLARQGAAAAGVESLVRFELRDVADLQPPAPPFTVCTNPPWGEREDGNVVASWRALGTFLHERCGGATAWVLSGNPELTRHLRLKTDRRVPIRTGPIQCRWLRYAIAAPPRGC